MRVLFLVNGSSSSAGANRALMFSQVFEVGDYGDGRVNSRNAIWSSQILFRPEQKWKGFVRFVYAGLSQKPDLVYVVDTAYAGVLAGLLVKALTKCVMITDTGDEAFELARSTGKYTPVQLSLIRWTEKLAQKKSDAVVVRGSYHREALLHKSIRRVECVPDGIDISALRKCEKREVDDLKLHLGLNSQYIIGMVGSMTWSERHRLCYGWDIVESLAHLRDLPVKGLLVGDGDGRIRLEERARILGVEDRVVFAGRIPQDKVCSYVKAMDFCVSTQSNDAVGWARTTGKLPLYLAAGCHVIATDVGEAHRVLPGIGSLLPYVGVRDDDHPTRLAGEVRRLILNPQLLEAAKKGPEVAAANFEYSMLAARVVNLAKELCIDANAFSSVTAAC